MQRVEVTVTDRTKTIMGIETRVVHDLVTEDGRAGRGHVRLVRAGRGREHLVPRRGHEGVRGREGLVDHEGSWEAGVDGALAGILLPADPRSG